MRVSAAFVLVVCVVAAIGALGAGPAMGQVNDTTTEAGNASQTIGIELEADGDATVSVRNQFTLETSEDRRAFERLADEFEGGEANGELSIDAFERVAADAENETGREMAITNVDRSVETTNSTGTLELQFGWEGFANTEDGGLVVGDVFEINGGTWLPSLSADQRLTISVPENHGLRTVSPETIGSSGEFAWEGPRSFETGEPTVVLITGDQDDEGLSWLSVGLGLGLVAAIAALVYVLSRRRSDAPIVPTPTGDNRGWATVLTPASNRAEESRRPPPARSNPEFEDDPTPESKSDPFADVDEELLSDEERVLRLLEVNDGRMKQASIVTETDWSNAKVSQLLSAMEDRREIEKLRIGRENLITLHEE